MYGYKNQATLEELFAETLGRARAFSAAVRGSAFPCNAREEAFITRCLSALDAGRILEDDIEGTLGAIRSVFCREIARETFETRRVFDGYHDPEIGDVGSVVEIPIRTVRGEELAKVLNRLDALVEVREAALDRMRAEKEVRKRI